MKHTSLRISLLCSGLLISAGIQANQQYVKAVAQFLDELRPVVKYRYHSQDWHPANHISFVTHPHWAKDPNNEAFQTGITPMGCTQIKWPVHCVQGTKGAEFAPGIRKQGDKVIQKGVNPDFDSYSALKDDGGAETGLGFMLHRDGIEHLITLGIATDYCVHASALHTLQIKRSVELILNACRGVQDEASIQKLKDLVQDSKTLNITFKIRYVSDLGDGMTQETVNKYRNAGLLIKDITKAQLINRIKQSSKKVGLLIVDIQNDFLAGGPLAVTQEPESTVSKK